MSNSFGMCWNVANSGVILWNVSQRNGLSGHNTLRRVLECVGMFRNLANSGGTSRKVVERLGNIM